MSYSKSFLMTLGHNSSVIFYDCDGKPIGYEEERLSEIKSDSAYPMKAFEKVLSQLTKEQISNSNIFISHWFDTFELQEFPERYFNHEHFLEIVSKYNLDVTCVNSSFTHHDAHAYSTLAFSENFQNNTIGDDHFIVADGFGNNQEVLSIYKKDNKTNLLVPIKKVFGFEHSLGLLYQYATSFCGMKENQDEYKFLGYEASITEFLLESQIEKLSILAYNFSLHFSRDCLKTNTFKPVFSGGLIDFEKLALVKTAMHHHFQDILNELLGEDYAAKLEDEFEIRTIIGYYVQACLEQSLLRIISKYKIKNAYLSGGCFLNVKLNKVILDNIRGKICVNPLAGDQGAAIGLFRKYTNTKFNFCDLTFGVRDRINLAQVTKCHLTKENIFIIEDDAVFVDCVSSFLNSGNIVNIMQNDMEFGPRALCNTSTLAMPTAENSAYINRVNNRNEVMPMAPVVSKENSATLMDFQDLDRVIGSNEFMIITHDVKVDTKHYRGILHNKPLSSGFTCRPQVVNHNYSNISSILQSVRSLCLINTSFNTHGRPILYSFESAIEDFRKQRKQDSEDRLILVILNKND